MMVLDETIKNIRKELNVTQERFARDLSVSYTTVNRWEKGRNVPGQLAKLRIIELCKERDVPRDIYAPLE
jgi:DNA-binding transcriptional regulator YiaG